MYSYEEQASAERMVSKLVTMAPRGTSCEHDSSGRRKALPSSYVLTYQIVLDVSQVCFV